MKVIYEQLNNNLNCSLNHFGIKNCFFKKLTYEYDFTTITKKPHRHRSFEMHIVTHGCQIYETAGKIYKLEKGDFILIYPHSEHILLNSTLDSQRYSITFSKETEDKRSCFFGNICNRMCSNLEFISKEYSAKKEISDILIENNILEIILLAFRQIGIKENKTAKKPETNALIELAKQYIEDNIKKSPDLKEISEYCHLSIRQLTRLFRNCEGISPKKYIIHKRIEHIEKLLATPSIPLKQISSVMNFENEYYFNTFFKNHAGMPPGEYRKMFKAN